MIVKVWESLREFWKEVKAKKLYETFQFHVSHCYKSTYKFNISEST